MDHGLKKRTCACPRDKKEERGVKEKSDKLQRKNVHLLDTMRHEGKAKGESGDIGGL